MSSIPEAVVPRIPSETRRKARYLVPDVPTQNLRQCGELTRQDADRVRRRRGKRRAYGWKRVKLAFICIASIPSNKSIWPLAIARRRASAGFKVSEVDDGINDTPTHVPKPSSHLQENRKRTQRISLVTVKSEIAFPV